MFDYSESVSSTTSQISSFSLGDNLLVESASRVYVREEWSLVTTVVDSLGDNQLAEEMLAVPVRQTSEGDLESVGHKESGQHEETCRKRKRKDERKSWIFVYNVPKKTSRKTKSCVCRQKDDGRKYWNCEGCDEWYHPECMGLKVEEEPDEYICPGCQVKNNEQFEKDCPTLSEVEEELLESIRIEEADQYDDNLFRGPPRTTQWPYTSIFK